MMLIILEFLWFLLITHYLSGALLIAVGGVSVLVILIANVVRKI